jgi:small-conductance mechanosensitive channel
MLPPAVHGGPRDLDRSPRRLLAQIEGSAMESPTRAWGDRGWTGAAIAWHGAGFLFTSRECCLMTELAKLNFYGNGARAWLTAIIVVAVAVPLLLATRRLLVRRLGALAERTSLDVDDLVVALLERTHGAFLFLVALFGASFALELPDTARAAAKTAVFAGLILQLGVWGSQTIRYGLRRYEKHEPGSQGTVTAMAFMAKLGLWAVVTLLLLDNFGLHVTALVTTLGVGGVAVALAAQSVLGDLLAAISIFLDKPFVVGDFIIVDDYLGSIASVGLRSTRIQSLSGEQIVMSNSDLLKSRIRNYKQMQERRVVFQLGVRHGTPSDVLAGIPKAIRAAVEAEPRTRFDRAHLKGFGESSIDFETVYYVLGPDYNEHMDILQAVHLAILRHFEESAIGFAHPIRMTTIEESAPRPELARALPPRARATRSSTPPPLRNA